MGMTVQHSDTRFGISERAKRSVALVIATITAVVCIGSVVFGNHHWVTILTTAVVTGLALTEIWQARRDVREGRLG